MTQPTPTGAPQSRGPSIAWFFVAALIFLCGAGGMGVLIWTAVRSITNDIVRFVVPGQTEMTVAKPGSFTIFHEYRSVVDGRVFSVQTLSNLIVTVRSKSTGAEVPLITTTGASYSTGSRAGRSILDFELREPGTYIVSAAYGDGRREPQTVLTISQGFGASLVFTILGALALFFGGLGGAVGLTIYVAVKRQKARQPPGLPFTRP